MAAFAKVLQVLSGSIDTLHESGEGPYDRSLSNQRNDVIRQAKKQLSRVNKIQHAVGRMGMLTHERRDDFARLRVSLDYIAAVLRASFGNSWGFRITEESAPTATAQEWNEHWHTLRHISNKLQQWAMAMTDSPVENESMKLAQQEDEVTVKNVKSMVGLIDKLPDDKIKDPSTVAEREAALSLTMIRALSKLPDVKREAFRLEQEGNDQYQIVEALTKEGRVNQRGGPIEQSTVSRWIRDVKKALTDGGCGSLIKEKKKHSDTTVMDPSKIGLGKRSDPTTSRQRKKLSE